MKINVCVLVGGSSVERDVSFKSADEILENIDTQKYNVNVIEISEDDTQNKWIKDLIENIPDIVLSALHGGSGENGAVQGLLDCLNIAYVGSKVLSSSICMDKYLSKVIMKANCIPVAEDVFIKKHEEVMNYEERINQLGYPVIIKPNKGGSSIGIAIANNYEQCNYSILEIKKYDDVLIEKFIDGREVSCGVVQTKNGLEVLSVLDIMSSNEFYDYNAKYFNDKTKIDFSTLPDFLQVMIKEIAKKVFNILNCEGYGMIDIIVHEEQIYVLEINTLPGLTKHSIIPAGIKGIGMSFGEFLDSLIEYELNKTQKAFY